MKSLCILLFLPLLSTHGALTWANTKVGIDATATDTEATGTFRFKNGTQKPIKIDSTKTSCGCTTAKLTKMIYAPGESGEIVAHFDIGGRMGVQSKTITVTTDDAPNQPTVLELTVNIPDALEITGQQLNWKVGEKPRPQIFTVKVAEGYKIKVTNVRCSNENFTAQIESAKEGSLYNIAVTPVKTDARNFALLIVTTDYPTKDPRVVYSKLQVQ